MTTSTLRISSVAAAREGFTLAEVIIATTLSALVLAGVLSAFLMVGRTGFAAGNYSEIDAQVRRALETVGADAREALDLRWHSPQSVTLYLPSTGAGRRAVTYGYDSVPTSADFRSFFRLEGDETSSAPRLILARDVAPDLAFQRFKLVNASGTDNSAHNDLETKQLQLTLRVARRHPTTVATTQTATSARYILRNKRVTN
jgi:type II secretory pathway pseudopilin PulG